MTRSSKAAPIGAYQDLRSCQWTIFLVSCGVLVLEVAITRLFSVLMYYHFGFMAVSLAMFGLGASGLWLFRFEDRYDEKRFRRSVALWATAAAVSVALALGIILRLPITLEYSNANAVRLILIYATLLIPFFCAGMAIALILFKRSLEVSRLYSWDLIGAALGAFVTVPLLNTLGAIGTCLAAAALFGFGAMTIGWTNRKWRVIPATVLALVITLTALNEPLGLLQLKYLKGRVKEQTAFEGWNAYSYITVQKPDARGDLAKIEIDADAATFILRDPFNTWTSEQLRESVALTWASSSAHEMARPGGRSLIIGPGGGIDVVFALAAGAAQIDAVELNPIIANDVMKGEFAGFAGDIYSRPEVNLVIDEGRSFVRRSAHQYDHIQLTLVDTWAATAAGAFSLSENHLYTIEAFDDYIAHLTPDGILSITRWAFPQPREALRLMTTAFAAAERAGIDNPKRHVIIAAIPLPGSGMRMASFIFKRSPITQGDHQMVMDRVRATSGELLYSPFDQRQSAYYEFARTADPAGFIASYEYNVSPVNDDQPFFFNIIRMGGLRGIFSLELESRKNNIGILNLIGVAIISVILVGLFFIGPLLTMKRGRQLLQTRGGLAMMAYFVAIGLGFILVEVALIQQFVLYLGHPVHALTVILTSLLVCAGFGALHSRSVPPERCLRYRGWHFAGLVTVILLEVLAMPQLFQATLHMVLWIRVAISVVALAPLGFLLGHPFPIGLKHVESRRHEMIPWAWGLNGAASVLGSVGAIAIAMLAGYTVVVIVGTVCYLGAWLCLAMAPAD
jgi:spermidine synthase